MTTSDKKQEELKALIAELPVSDGRLPVNDVKDAAGKVVTKGAHGVANETEAKIAGMLKGRVIAEKLRNIAIVGEENPRLDQSIRDIAGIATSYDAAEDVKLDHPLYHKFSAELQAKYKTVQEYKIDTLDLSATAKHIVGKTIAYTKKPDAALAKKIVTLAKAALAQGHLGGSEDTAPLVTDAIREAAKAKHYEITAQGNLFNPSSVRLHHVPGHPGSHGDLQAAADSVSNDATQRAQALATFITNLKGSPTLTGDTFAMFDIGYGDGQTALQGIKALETATGAKVEYAGMDLVPKAHEKAQAALRAAGRTEDAERVMQGTFGEHMADARLTPLKGKQNLVVASHVYNTKDLADFTAQADALLAKNGVMYVLHETNKGSWLADFRTKHADKLRPDAADKSAQIEKFLSGKNRTFATFRVKTTDTIAPLTKKEIGVFKNMETGVFTTDHSQQFAEGAERESFVKKQQLLEYFMRAPLEAFTKEDRAVLIDDFQQMLVKAGGKLERYSEAQLVLSPQHTLEAEAAVRQAAEKTNAMFAAQEKTVDAAPAKAAPTPAAEATQAQPAAEPAAGTAPEAPAPAQTRLEQLAAEAAALRADLLVPKPKTELSQPSGPAQWIKGQLDKKGGPDRGGRGGP